MQHDFVSGTTEDGPTQKDCCAQGRGLSVRSLRLDRFLVETEQVEGEEHRQEGGFARKEALHAEAVGVEFRFEFFDPLLDQCPLVVVAPEQERVLVPVGDEDAERVAGHLQELAPHRRLAFANPLAHDDKTPGLFPTHERRGEFAHGIVLVDLCPLAEPRRLAFDVLGEAGDDHVRQRAGFQKLQEFLGEKAGIGSHAAQLPAARQERKGLLEKLGYAATRGGVAAAQPSMENARGLGQHRQQRVVALASGPMRVVALGRAFLLAAALEDRRIQIETEALGGRSEEGQNPAPERTPKRLDGPLGEPAKEITDRVGARKPGDAKHGVERLVGPQPVGMSESARPDKHRAQEGHQRVGGRDRVGAAQLEGHRVLELGGQTEAAKKLDQADHAAERGDGLGGAA